MKDVVIKNKEIKQVETYMDKIMTEITSLSNEYFLQVERLCSDGLQDSAIQEVARNFSKPLAIIYMLEEQRRIDKIQGKFSNKILSQLCTTIEDLDKMK